MTSHAMILGLFGFNQAMNDRLWSIIMTHLTDAQFTQPDDYSRGSIRNQFVHMADAQRYWLRGLLKVPDIPPLNAEDYPTREAARAICQHSDQLCLDKVRELSEAELEQVVDGWGQPIWVALLQMSLHSTDHRAQILHALYDLGAPTFDQTFAVYMEQVTPLSVSELLGHIRSKRAEWEDLLRQLPTDRMNQPVIDRWTIRDTIAILTWKERCVTEMIRTRAAAEASFGELSDAEQARILEAGRALPLDTLLDQHQAAYSEMLNTLRVLTDAELNASEGIPGLPPDERFWKPIAGATWWSYPAFSAPLRRLLNERDSSATG